VPYGDLDDRRGAWAQPFISMLTSGKQPIEPRKQGGRFTTG
jgi:hypothetical protein